MDIFQEYLSSFYRSVLKQWIPGLLYKHITKIRASSMKMHNSDGKRSRTHYIAIDNIFLIFVTKYRQLRGPERALIDMSLCKLYEYSKQQLDYPQTSEINQNVIRYVISTFLLFPGFSLSSPWKVYNKALSYYGTTEEHYGLKTRDVLDKNEYLIVNNIYNILRSAESLSMSTNEGEPLSLLLAFFLGETNKTGKYWSEIKDLQYIKSLSSKKSAFFITQDEIMFDYRDISKSDVPEIVNDFFNMKASPLLEEDICVINYIANYQMSDENKDVFFFSVQQDGSIYIYKNRTVVFFMKKGNWHFFNFEGLNELINRVIGFFHAYDTKDMSLTIIDMLFGCHGCCLGIINKDTWVKNFDSKIETGEIDEFVSSKSSICRCFWKNTREVRKNLLSIDGAVLVDAETGNIYNVGAIIPNEGASGVGARTTAAKEIARNGGLAIKISDDGYCQIFAPGHEKSSYSLGL